MTGQAFDFAREAETYDSVLEVLNALNALENRVKAGPRLTKGKEALRDAGIHSIRAMYQELARACRRNLER